MDREFSLEKKKKKEYALFMEQQRFLYVIFDREYSRNYGLPRTIRFLKVFDKFEDAMSYYRKIENYERFVFTFITTTEYLELKGRYK